MNSHKKLSEIKGLNFVGGQITSRIAVDEKKNEVAIGTVQVVPPKAIRGGKIIHSELYDIEYKAEFDEKKVTREGDIIVKLSSPYDAAYITKDDEGLLITSFCIIVRNIGKAVDSKYLAAYFNSNVYLNKVMNLVSGAAVPMLTISKVKEAEIKEMSLEEQKQVADYYRDLCEKEEVMAKILELEKEKLDSVLGGK